MNRFNLLALMLVAFAMCLSRTVHGAEHQAPNTLPDWHPMQRVRDEWQQIGNHIDGEADLDESGSAVSLSSDGTTVAIGAPYNEGNGVRAGHVRVYRSVNNHTWSQLGSDIDGEAAYNYFGQAVSLSANGEIVAIGAPYNKGNGGRLQNSGHVRVYCFVNNHTWSQLGQDIDGNIDGKNNILTNGNFGHAVSLSANGEIVAIGAYEMDTRNDIGINNRAGHVRVYRFVNNHTWSQLGQDIDGEAANDHSGYSVSLSSDGTTVAIGAIGNDNGNGIGAGHVRVYRFVNNHTWSQLGQDIDGEAASDMSGKAVSLSSDGQIVAIGATGNNGNGIDAGHVRVYRFLNNTWSQLGQDIDGDGLASEYTGRSGHSVSLSSDGKIVAVGVPRYSESLIHKRGNGRVKIYTFNGTIWTQKGKDIKGEDSRSNSGSSVSLSADGTTVAIGAPGDTSYAMGWDSHVSIYSYRPTPTTPSPTPPPTSVCKPIKSWKACKNHHRCNWNGSEKKGQCVIKTPQPTLPPFPPTPRPTPPPTSVCKPIKSWKACKKHHRCNWNGSKKKGQCVIKTPQPTLPPFPPTPRPTPPPTSVCKPIKSWKACKKHHRCNWNGSKKKGQCVIKTPQPTLN